MITDFEYRRLFGVRDLKAESASRLTRKEFPSALRLPYRFDVARLKGEYDSLLTTIGRSYSEYEDGVVRDALGLANSYIADNGQDYWPLVLSGPNQDVLEVQKAIDHRRGMDWKTHQSRLSDRQRITSITHLNDDYDPMIDERLCTRYHPAVLGGYVAECLSMFRSKPTRARFAYLKPGDRVSLHTDYDPSYSVRAHFPLTTNDRCFNGYRLNGKLHRFHMEPGRVYLVNNGIPHFAINDGKTGRLHLIVSLDGQEDYLAQKESCELPPAELLEDLV